MTAQEKVLQTLDEHNIPYTIMRHPAVYTIEEMENLQLAGIDDVVKNLFVRDDKKQNYYLVVLQKNKHANLKELQNTLQSRRLTFACEEDLQRYLGLTKGAVTPLGILNDAQHKVTVVLDEDIKKQTQVAVHPNVNTATVWFAVASLEKLITECGNTCIWVKL